MSRAKKQQQTKGAKIEVLLERMDRIIVTARSSNQAIEDMIILKEELESFRPTQYSDTDSSSGEAESGEE
jgi:hypothetical protein